MLLCAVRDHRAVQQMIKAQMAPMPFFPLGGKLDMPAIGRKGEPLEVSGTVKLIFDGRFRNRSLSTEANSWIWGRQSFSIPVKWRSW